MMIWKVRHLIIGILLSFGLCLTSFNVASGEVPGSDIQGHWAESQITSWKSKGYMNGYQDGSFKPNHAITRAEFITLVNRSFGYTSATEVTFKDLAPTDWEYAEVQKAVLAGYIAGYEDMTIRTKNEISRQEVAFVISRLLSLSPSEDAAKDYKDAKSIPTWSKGAIGAVALKKIITGYEDNTYQPLAAITRAEAVVSLDRALQP